MQQHAAISYLKGGASADSRLVVPYCLASAATSFKLSFPGCDDEHCFVMKGSEAGRTNTLVLAGLVL